jgi:hypothetical protein
LQVITRLELVLANLGSTPIGLDMGKGGYGAVGVPQLRLGIFASQIAFEGITRVVFSTG